ncbi:MAG: prepilin-type N-terminal cleavage/methylation domain-containing protein [Phycisphaerae bacterium]
MSRRRGLSLIEVVLALVILALALPPFALQVRAGAEAYVAARTQQILAALASERVTEVFADHALATRGHGYVTSAAYPRETDAGGRTGYVRDTTVVEVDPADFATPRAGTGVKRFRVWVRAPDGREMVVQSFVVNATGAAP